MYFQMPNAVVAVQFPFIHYVQRLPKYFFSRCSQAPQIQDSWNKERSRAAADTRQIRQIQFS